MNCKNCGNCKCDKPLTTKYTFELHDDNGITKYVDAKYQYDTMQEAIDAAKLKIAKYGDRPVTYKITKQIR